MKTNKRFFQPSFTRKYLDYPVNNKILDPSGTLMQQKMDTSSPEINSS
jgi:hypothetical protein